MMLETRYGPSGYVITNWESADLHGRHISMYVSKGQPCWLMKEPPEGYMGRHSEEAAEVRGLWLRWRDALPGSPSKFRHGGKSKGTMA